MNSVLYGVLVVLGGFLGGVSGQLIYKVASRHIFRRREERFLRFVRVLFPNATEVESITVATSDQKAIENLERRLRNASRTL